VRVAIIGFGFSGLMVAANLLRMTSRPMTLYIIDETSYGHGVAYGTTNPQHLLNVAAGNMGAFADDVGGFATWLRSEHAAQHGNRMGIQKTYAAQDFAPRTMYAGYLTYIWQQAQEIAAQKHCSIKLVPSRVVAINSGSTLDVLTARGDAIAVDRAVLTCGHEMKPSCRRCKARTSFKTHGRKVYLPMPVPGICPYW